MEKTTYNALRICTLIGLNVPVAKGRVTPLIKDPMVAPNVHGQSGLDGPKLPEPAFEVSDMDAVTLMAKVLEESEEPVTLIPTGPLTNVAVLFLAHPELKSKIEHIYIMGGGIHHGNWAPAAEFNIQVDPEAADIVSQSIDIRYDPVSRIGVAGRISEERVGKITVMTAGTSDIPVAEEAAQTAEALGNNVVRVFDAGVSGIHRLLAHSEDIMTSRVIVAVAGMEGALASVVGGMADCPVIAVPTSVGYGASFGGLSALLTMLNSCASGVSVVNIDNGFGAGYLASMINHIGLE